MAFGDLFDAYGRQARLQPALLALFPLVVTVAVWFPALYEFTAGLLGLAVACGVTVFLAHAARMRGRSIERRLFSIWGGRPTTIWLRHRDTTLDPHTTSRYHQFVATHLPTWDTPTEADEHQDPIAADDLYDSAVRWLLEYTRDRQKFPLVFKENVSYGFRRNLFGLKPLGITISSACLAGNLGLITLGLVEGGTELNLTGSVAAMLSFFALLLWSFFVSVDWVRDAANGYAKALLSSCDS